MSTRKIALLGYGTVGYGVADVICANAEHMLARVGFAPEIKYICDIADFTGDKNEHIIIADNYFDKTKANILSTGIASVLFITKEGRSYQLKGTMSYHRDGPFYDFMMEVTPPKFPRRAAVVLHATEIYSGSERLR